MTEEAYYSEVSFRRLLSMPQETAIESVFALIHLLSLLDQCNHPPITWFQSLYQFLYVRRALLKYVIFYLAFRSKLY